MLEEVKVVKPTIKVSVQRGVCGALVWQAEDVYRLRIEWRVIGGLVGALPLQPRQNTQLGLPLLLAPEEVTLLTDKGVLDLQSDTPPRPDDVITPTSLTNEQQEQRSTVYRDLWERGYTLTSGLKYGADYLVYRGDPALVHSCYLALVLPWQQPIRTLPSLCRVGSKVVKRVLLCSVERGSVWYQTATWDSEYTS